MINYIKVFKHKGIDLLELKELGQLNIVCGKNSSGKSSILEAISISQNHTLGFLIQDAEEILKYFHGEANRYSSPNPLVATEFFKRFWNEQFADSIPIIYESDKGEWVQGLVDAQKVDPQLRNHAHNLYNYKDIITQFIDERTTNIGKAILVPPKRKLQIEIPINFQVNLEPNGIGVLNTLFYLKNQAIGSDDYECYRKILSQFQQITAFDFNIVPDKENNISVFFRARSGEGAWLSSDKCGLGLSDLLVMLTFILSTEFSIYLLEEPENHLHADFQKKLMSFLREQESKQFILSTHSDVFIDHTSVSKVFHCWFDNQVNISDKTSLSKIASDLGYSLNEHMSSDAVLLVEGPTDIPIMKRIFEWLGTLDNFNIKFWPLGGDIMGELDLTIFDGKKVFSIIDQDPQSQKVRNRFIKNCRSNSILCHKLERYAIENYFTLDAIKHAFLNQIPSSLHKLDPMQKVDDQLNFSAKKKSVKSRCNTIINHMSLDDVKGTDLLEAIEKIHNKLVSTEQEGG